MNEDEVIASYLHEVEVFLHLDKDRRGRVLEEIESHLRDGAATYISEGADPAQAAVQVTEEFGSPRSVAAAFADDLDPVRASTGAWRWTPMVVPGALLVLALVVIAISLTWLPGGMTAGERAAQPRYLRSGAIAAALTYGAFFSIRRADTDRAWRIAAWACTAAAMVFLVT